MWVNLATDKIMQRQQIKEVFAHSPFITKPDPSVLVNTVQSLLEEDIPRDDLLGALDDFRQGLDEQSENIVLDVMDRLEGNCSPYSRL